MRKMILLITCSLDGFIAKDNGSIDWLVGNEDYDFAPFFNEIDTVLMGFTTYKQVLTFGNWPYEGKECYVFSRNYTNPGDENVIFSDNLLKTVDELRKVEGKAI